MIVCVIVRMSHGVLVGRFRSIPHAISRIARHRINPEEIVLQTFFRRDSSFGIKREHLLEQIDGLAAQMTKMFSELVRHRPEIQFAPQSQLGCVRPTLLRGRSANFPNLLERFKFCFCRKEWIAHQQLSENATRKKKKHKNQQSTVSACIVFTLQTKCRCQRRNPCNQAEAQGYDTTA
jgi:hypothetical protein